MKLVIHKKKKKLNSAYRGNYALTIVTDSAIEVSKPSNEVTFTLTIHSYVFKTSIERILTSMYSDSPHSLS